MKNKISLILLIIVFIQIKQYGQNIPYRNLFDDSKVGKIYISLPPDSLTWLYNNVLYDNNIKADFVFVDGIKNDTVKNVGFRLRGNTSRQSKKKSFKVKFNAYTKGIKYQGVKELNLNGNHNDPTMSREKLYYDVWKRFGLPERRISYVSLYLNNSFYGLYTNVEELDDEWLKRVMKSDTGNFYKCTYPANLAYINDNPATYKALNNSTASGGRVYDLKTNEALDDYTNLVKLIKTLNQSGLTDAQAYSVLNVNDFLKALAVEVNCGHWDDYAYNKNNFFLYDNPISKTFDFISYDADNTFGVNFLSPNWTTRNIYTWHSKADGPIVEQILKSKYFRNLYSLYTKQLINDVLKKLDPRIDSLRTLIKDIARSDSYYPRDYNFTMQNFNDNFDYTAVGPAKFGLKQFLSLRTTNSLNQLETISPVSALDLSEIKVFPNAFRDFLTIESKSFPILESALIDTQGKIILTQKGLSERNLRLNTEGVTSGIYILQLKTKEGLKSVKVVKVQ
jgi:CotH kinase protein/Secretion system C-terminal sorting domain